MGSLNRRIDLVAFDLDGTLLRGETVCLAIASRLGHRERMLALERLTSPDDIRAAREEMASWYRAAPMTELSAALETLQLAPAAREGFELLKQHGVHTAIVSITWEFAVAHFARKLGADEWIGTVYQPDGPIGHVLPEDKPRYVARLAEKLGVPLDRVAAVGDSLGDLPMLRSVGLPIFVGTPRPAEPDGLVHVPDADIRTIAEYAVG